MNQDEILIQLAELKTHVEWIRAEMNKNNLRYAPYWIKYPVYVMCMGALSWTGLQLLSLIQTVKAFLQ